MEKKKEMKSIGGSGLAKALTILSGIAAGPLDIFLLM